MSVQSGQLQVTYSQAHATYCSDSGPLWRRGGSGSVSGRSTAATSTGVKDLKVGGQGSPRNYIMSVTRQHGGSVLVLDIELVPLRGRSI